MLELVDVLVLLGAACTLVMALGYEVAVNEVQSSLEAEAMLRVGISELFGTCVHLLMIAGVDP